MIRHFFVTGTDTDCGKTLVSLAYMQALAHAGLTVAGMKPVASGAIRTPDGFRNQDALALHGSCNVDVTYGQVNPYCFEPPVAPHLAAEQAGEVIRLSAVQDAYSALSSAAEAVVVEGVGGWRVPLGDQLDVAKMCSALGLPVILVVGLRLGCLNQALLSVESIERYNIRLAGWVANQVDPDMLLAEQNVRSLTSYINAPLLGQLPFMPQADPVSAATYLDIPG